MNETLMVWFKVQEGNFCSKSLTHFKPIFHFYTPLKTPENI